MQGTLWSWMELPGCGSSLWCQGRWSAKPRGAWRRRAGRSASPRRSSTCAANSRTMIALLAGHRNSIAHSLNSSTEPLLRRVRICFRICSRRELSADTFRHGCNPIDWRLSTWLYSNNLNLRRVSICVCDFLVTCCATMFWIQPPKRAA